ncbi:M60 family metallopeptidase [Streptomyces sp. NRRL S-350]|uniref:M60 family metallopeptidase n=1 Tax=Streptomyces sp. NRRL S-350 TaxID=1463902 RepID=UPI0004BF8112|nr:M60 family metallopeptidase [Streptomyces sp. NRRL S-350]
MNHTTVQRGALVLALAILGAASLAGCGPDAKDPRAAASSPSGSVTSPSGSATAPAAGWADGPAPVPGQPERVTLTGLPGVADEQARLGDWLSLSSARPTGLYLPPGQALHVDASVTGGRAKVVVGAPDTDPAAAESREHEVPGGNSDITDTTGGMVYLSFDGTPADTATITLTGATPVPFFQLGHTTAEQWRTMLAQRTTPYAELVGPHTVMTVTREAAIANQAVDQAAALRKIEHVLAVEDKTAGLVDQTSPGAPGTDDRSPLAFHYVETRTLTAKEKESVYAYATDTRIGFPTNVVGDILNPDKDHGWSVWHESGHPHQQSAITPESLAEVTVNIYSLAVQRDAGQPSRLIDPKTEENADGTDYFTRTIAKLGRPGLDFTKDFDDFDRLVMFEQLRLAYGDDLWSKVTHLVRTEKPTTTDDTPDDVKSRNLVLYVSKATHHDLTGFFATWGFPVDTQTRAAVARLNFPKPTVDPSTLRDRA